MGGKSSPPPAPDPNATASAQSQYDKSTAAYNAALNRYNVYTPYGNQTWQRSGTDASGAPIYSQNISLSPQAQATLNQNMANANNLSQTQGQLLNNARTGLAQPVNTEGLPGYAGPVNHGDLSGLANQATQASYNSQMSMLEPQYAQQQEQTKNELANQGLAADSEAYQNAMGNLNRQQDWSRTQAANNATLQGMQYDNQLFNQGVSNAYLQNQAQQGGFQQALTLHDQPLNEYNSMMTGTQVQAPQFQSNPTVMANAPNYQNAVNSAYQGQLNAYNAQTGSQNSFMGGLMGVASAMPWGQWFSDRRLKSKIIRIGTHKSGIGIYEYDIFGKRQRGVMADEVEAVIPEAVIAHPSGFKAVDYARLQ